MPKYSENSLGTTIQNSLQNITLNKQGTHVLSNTSGMSENVYRYLRQMAECGAIKPSDITTLNDKLNENAKTIYQEAKDYAQELKNERKRKRDEAANALPLDFLAAVGMPLVSHGLYLLFDLIQDSAFGTHLKYTTSLISVVASVAAVAKTFKDLNKYKNNASLKGKGLDQNEIDTYFKDYEQSYQQDQIQKLLEQAHLNYNNMRQAAAGAVNPNNSFPGVLRQPAHIQKTRAEQRPSARTARFGRQGLSNFEEQSASSSSEGSFVDDDQLEVSRRDVGSSRKGGQDATVRAGSKYKAQDGRSQSLSVGGGTPLNAASAAGTSFSEKKYGAHDLLAPRTVNSDTVSNGGSYISVPAEECNLGTRRDFGSYNSSVNSQSDQELSR